MRIKTLKLTYYDNTYLYYVKKQDNNNDGESSCVGMKVQF